MGRVRAIVHCEHPNEGCSPAVVLESDGSHLPIRWCGTCGAIRSDQIGDAGWIRPGLSQVLGEEDHLTAVADGMRVFVESLARLTKAARSLGARIADLPEAERAEISSGVLELESACAEFDRGACGALRELGL